MTAACTLEQLRQFAAECDLPEVGVTNADPFPELIPWLTAYEERGRTGFEVGDIEQRIHPKRWLPSAKSIVVTALPYLTPEGNRMARSHPHGRQHGISSCYTYGDDYHTVFSKRLRQLHERLQSELGQPIEAKLSVDTSPLVDRRIAERAGLGWIGKNSMFYSNRFGSYVFLGAMLVDIGISPSAAHKPVVGAQCGSCTRCLQACPTGAILAPGVIDATRCLSYVTQMKGMIPREFRAKMGRRVWGCDVCQAVCPENQRVRASDDSVFGPNEALAYPDLIQFLHLSNRQFMRLYGHTAMAWRGLRTLQRNALIALGNIGSNEAVPELVPFLDHARLELRGSAAWALGRIGGEAALNALQTALATEAEPSVVEELENGVKACHGHR